MASIFNNKPKQPPVSEQRFADIELSISKRYEALETKIENRIAGMSDRFSKLDEQVSVLLKRTYDLERRLESRFIEVDNQVKQNLLNYDSKIDAFRKQTKDEFVLRENFLEMSDAVAGSVRKVKLEVDNNKKLIDKTNKAIPTGVAKATQLDKAVSDFDKALLKIANSIPKNTITAESVAGIRKDLIAQMQVYATTDALKAISKEVDNKINKSNKSNNAVASANQKVQRELGIVADKVNNIQEDYLDSRFNKVVESKLKKVNSNLQSQIKETNKAIPTNFITANEFNILLEKQKQLTETVDNNLTTSNDSVSIISKTTENKIQSLTTKLNTEIENLKQSVVEAKLGEDTSSIKLMVRELLDIEIRDIKNTNEFSLGNLKEQNISRKNEIKATAQRINELRKDLDKAIALVKLK